MKSSYATSQDGGNSEGISFLDNFTAPELRKSRLFQIRQSELHSSPSAFQE